MGNGSCNGKVLTLIIPSYNMEEYLARCCESVLVEQEMMDRLEVIVVNDGSKDATSDIAHEFKRRYPETFNVIDKNNGHYGSCVNAALKIATGTFVKLLDADDTVDTSSFAAYVQFLSSLEDSPPDLVLTDAIRVDREGHVLEEHKCNLLANKVMNFADLPKRITSNIWATWVTYRVEMLRSIGYSQTEGIPFTDVQWTVLPMARVKKVAYFPVVLYRYLIGREGQSIKSGNVMAQMVKSSARMALDSLIWFLSYCSECDCANVSYLEDRILDMFRIAYAWTIFKIHTPEADAFLLKIDREFEELSKKYYSALGHDTVLMWNHIHYIDIWRKYPNAKGARIRFVRAIYELNLIAHKLMFWR